MKSEDLFDFAYFNGGGKVGGYAREGYWDYPAHWKTFNHVMQRRPESVLELGCARGYIIKRIQDTGIRANGLEVSRHCWLTRACEGIICKDICDDTHPWPYKDGEFDLCFSIAVLEHVPEDKLPWVLGEMSRVSKRALHGIDFGGNDDGFDQTHCTLRPKEWWKDRFQMFWRSPDKYVDGCEIVDKEMLEQGEIPPGVLSENENIKLNLGSHISMFHFGWVNVDGLDLNQFAQGYGYKFLQHDLRHPLPFPTGSVSMINAAHVFDTMSYREAEALIKECRRLLKWDGMMRCSVPDAELLTHFYSHRGNNPEGEQMDYFDELNDKVRYYPHNSMKLWSILHEGHASMYDETTLLEMLRNAGFKADVVAFRAGDPQMLRETVEICPCLSLAVECVPG